MQDRGNATEADFRGEWRGHQIPHRFEHRQYKRPRCTRRQDHGRLLFRHVCNVVSINKSPALWGRPERICPDSTCHSCGPEHRDISTPSEELSGRSRQIRRIISMGQEECREGHSGLYTTRI